MVIPSSNCVRLSLDLNDLDRYLHLKCICIRSTNSVLLVLP